MGVDLLRFHHGQNIVPRPLAPYNVTTTTSAVPHVISAASGGGPANIFLCVGLVLFAGFASGMTVGLLSMDPVQLKVMTQQETNPKEKRKLERIEDLLRQHHLLLVTLLLANSIAMEALPIFLNKSVPEWAAVTLSVTAILLFGEIIPQAVCTGKRQVDIIKTSLPLVSFLIYFLYVLSWPIAKFLDFCLGSHEQQLYARSHLKALIRLHQRRDSMALNIPEENGGNPGATDGSSDSLQRSAAEEPLGIDEVNVIEGALDMATKSVGSVMVPVDQVFMLESSTPLTRRLRERLLSVGHSRVPIYSVERWNIKGLLYVKSLISIDSHETPKVGDLIRYTKMPVFCHPDMNLYDLLNEFQRGRHMAFVTEDPEWHKNNWIALGVSPGNCTDSPQLPPQLLGIVTLEDIIEELIQEEIYDEFDQFNSGVAPNLLSSSSKLIKEKLPIKRIVSHGSKPPPLPTIKPFAGRGGSSEPCGLDTPLLV